MAQKPSFLGIKAVIVGTWEVRAWQRSRLYSMRGMQKLAVRSCGDSGAVCKQWQFGQNFLFRQSTSVVAKLLQEGTLDS